MITFAFLNGFFYNKSVDSWGHLGGFITGFLLSFVLLKALVPED
jgi:membrane associated rhomboid family serine protease